MTLCLGALWTAPAGAWHASGEHWQHSTITYYSADSRLAWPLQWASYVWNSSGANVRFVKVADRRKADVVIVPKRIPAGSAEAGVAQNRGHDDVIVGAYVGLRVDLDPYTLALVATHEFGHVLGLAHEDRGCSIMNSWLEGDHPFRCAAPPAGKWWCRLLTPDDVTGVLALYGGRAVAPKQPVYCRRTS